MSVHVVSRRGRARHECALPEPGPYQQGEVVECDVCGRRHRRTTNYTVARSGAVWVQTVASFLWFVRRRRLARQETP